MNDTDPGKLADQLEREADDLERHSRQLGQRTEDVAQEWDRKRADPGVPGAPPPTEGQEAPPTGAPSGKGDDDEAADASTGKAGDG